MRPRKGMLSVVVAILVFLSLVPGTEARELLSATPVPPSVDLLLEENTCMNKSLSGRQEKENWVENNFGSESHW